MELFVFHALIIIVLFVLKIVLFAQNVFHHFFLTIKNVFYVRMHVLNVQIFQFVFHVKKLIIWKKGVAINVLNFVLNVNMIYQLKIFLVILVLRDLNYAVMV